MMMKMLLLSMMMIVNILSTSGGIFQEYPYFSQDAAMVGKESKQPHLKYQKAETSKNILLTYDQTSVEVLKEYIWIEEQ